MTDDRQPRWYPAQVAFTASGSLLFASKDGRFQKCIEKSLEVVELNIELNPKPDPGSKMYGLVGKWNPLPCPPLNIPCD